MSEGHSDGTVFSFFSLLLLSVSSSACKLAALLCFACLLLCTNSRAIHGREAQCTFFFSDVNAYESSDQSSKLSEVTINNYIYVLFRLFFLSWSTKASLDKGLLLKCHASCSFMNLLRKSGSLVDMSTFSSCRCDEEKRLLSLPFDEDKRNREKVLFFFRPTFGQRGKKKALSFCYRCCLLLLFASFFFFVSVSPFEQ